MGPLIDAGRIVVLNGAPRAGKSSVARAVQETATGTWINLGVDVSRRMTPETYQPGIGLRPGEPDHPAALLVPVLFAALYESIAAHARVGLDVVTDVGHHDLDVLADCARRLAGLTALFVGVRCPLETILERRAASGAGRYVTGSPDDPVPEPVRRWQEAVHAGWSYDLEVDTSSMDPRQCAAVIERRLADGPRPTALETLAARTKAQPASTSTTSPSSRT